MAPYQDVAQRQEDLDLMAVDQEGLDPYQGSSTQACHREDPHQGCHQEELLEGLCT